jgi:peptidoglycan/LPS O-acetylase OafA/YrhL
VISGFLITRLLLAELERTGGISLSVFYARRVKRLLPHALLVVATVAVLAGVLMSPVRADGVARDVIATGVYAMNWKLSADAVDYFATGSPESPLQHFWSLAVEEQFYLAWPALLLLATWWVRRRGAAVRPVLWVLLAAVTAGSFLHALGLVRDAPQAAYFSTFARAWELALGGLLALVLAERRLGRRAAALAAWAGMGAIVAATALFDGASGVPGVAALVPVLGAGALIAAGTAHAPPAPVRLLLLAPMQRAGRLSYAWYLWHWPAVVFAAEVFGPLSPLEGVLVVAGSLVPAVVGHRLVEEPLRRSRAHARAPRRALAFAPAGAVAAVALGAGLTVTLPSTPTLAMADVDGAARLEQTTSLQRRATALRPEPRRAEEDRSQVYDDGCLVRPRGTRSKDCVYGRRNAATTVVLFGDSHAMQHFGGLERVALRRDWRLVVLTKSGCSPAAVRIRDRTLGRLYEECEVWRERALRRIETRERPALVVTSSLTTYRLLDGDRPLGPRASQEALARGYARSLRRLKRAAGRVVAIRDTPHPRGDVPACVAEHLDDLRQCAFPRAEAFVPVPVERRAVDAAPGVKLIDPTNRFCPGNLCPAVIGDVLVYRNSAHITATYSRTLAGWLGRRLRTG